MLKEGSPWIFTACVLTLPLFAQPAATIPPTFKSGATLVEVTAVVRDAEGKAAAGLTRDDFQLFDSGKPQPITSFELVKLQDPALMQLRNASSSSTGGAESASRLPNHFVAFVVDDANLVPESMPLALAPAIRRVMDMRPGDRAAVVSTSGRM